MPPQPAKVPDRWYPRAFVEPGALGCEFGGAHDDFLVLAERNYATEDECCAAWPVLCSGITSTTSTTTAAAPTEQTTTATTTAVPPSETLYWLPDATGADCVIGEPMGEFKPMSSRRLFWNSDCAGIRRRTYIISPLPTPFL